MTDTDSFLKKMAKGIEKVHNVRFEEQKDGLGGADWKTSTFQPKTDAIIAAIKSGDVVLKSPEDSMCEEIDALKQRVKVLEEALGKIAATTDDEARRDPENLVLIAREVIDPNCGDCGDDGEEPSRNCPTCKGTGFKCQK